MKIEFVSVHLEGFRSFVEPTSFSLNHPSGLYFIRGQNELEPELAANGVGKSSLWESIFWCLFGKTTNGVTAANVSTWGSDHACVTLSLLVNGKEVKITRSRGPNRLTINNVDTTQDRVIATLGVTADLASSTILVGQFAQTFVERGHAERLEMFSQLLNLGRWEEYSECAKENAANLLGSLTKLASELAFNQGKHAGIDIASVERMSTEWAATQLTLIGRQTQAVKLADAVLNQTKQAVQYAQAEYDSLGEVLQPVFKDMPERPEPVQDEDIPKWEIKKRELEQRFGIVEMERDHWIDWRDKINQLGPVCGACGQPVNASYKESQVTVLNTAIDKARDDLEQITVYVQEIIHLIETRAEKNKASHLKSMKQWEIDCQVFRDKQKHDQQAYNEYVAAKSTLLRAYEAAKMKMLNATNNLAISKRELTKLETEVNPHLAHITSLRQQVADLSVKIKKLEANIVEMKQLHTEVTYWIGGFKKIRMLIVEESLRALEMAVNDALIQLGLRGWIIRLDAERELTTGAIKREFIINVQSPYNEELVPWDTWSGGERQRLRLALIFGLQTFMQQRTGVSTNLMFLDEPSNYLSEAGVNDMLAFLKDKALRDNLCIWLADHRSLDAGEFAGTFLIYKNETGSHIKGV